MTVELCTIRRSLKGTVVALNALGMQPASTPVEADTVYGFPEPNRAGKTTRSKPSPR